MRYTRSQFIEKVGPLAQKDAKSSKVLASRTIAQAILESNDGNSGLTAQGNALFGVNLNYNNWKKRADLIKLSNVPSLLTKFGGINQLVALGIIGQKDLWIKKQYNSAHVRALITKYAAQL